MCPAHRCPHWVRLWTKLCLWSCSASALLQLRDSRYSLSRAFYWNLAFQDLAGQTKWYQCCTSFFTHHLLLVKEQSSSLPWITKVPLHKLRQHINHCTVWIQNHAPRPTRYGWNMKRKLQVFTKLQNLKVLIFMNPVCTCDDVTIATCSHFRGLICPWVLQDSDKANKSACESEKPQHTKLFSRDQIRSQVSSTSHNPSLSLLPSLPCSLLPLDKLMNPGASSAGRR